MDIVDGDNAAEIAGGQRGLMMMLLASERASERANRASCSWTGTPLYSPLHPLPPVPDPGAAADAAPSLLPASSPHRPPRYPSFSNSDIPISRAVVPSPPCPRRGVFTRELVAIVH